MANSFQNEQEPPELARIAELAENLVYRLPGCPDITVRKAIQEVYREFCRETKCLTADRFIELESNRTEYPVGSMYGGVVGEIREVALDGMLLKRGRDYEVMDGTSPVVSIAKRFVVWPTEEADSDQHGFVIYPNGYPTVPPQEAHIRDRARKMRVKATEYPKLNSEKTPSWFVEKHGDAIASGVLSRLCPMTGKPWSDPQVADDERIRYENFKSEARMRMEAPPGGRFIDTSMVL